MVHLPIPREKRKMKKKVKKKSENKKGSARACCQGHVLLALPQPSPQY